MKTLTLGLLTGMLACGAPIQTTSFLFEFDGPNTPTGGFAYDQEANVFPDFAIRWNGILFDFAPLAQDPEITGTVPCLDGTRGPAATWKLLTACPGAYWMGEAYIGLNFMIIDWQDNTNAISMILDKSGPGLVSSGLYTGSYRVIEGPEPGTLGMMGLAALGGVAFAWKRRRPLVNEQGRGT